MRLDQYLVELFFDRYALTRSRAQELIRAGKVSLQNAQGEWKVVCKPGLIVQAPKEVRVQWEDQFQYVSRGGFKLEQALRYLDWNVTGLRVLDCGQSTGGFTDCLLQLGASQVVGFDVGHDQLHLKLKQDSRVQYFEGIHIQDLFQKSWAQGPWPLIVADLSFISLQKVLPHLAFLDFARALFLIKPQFEVGPQALNKKGIVKNQFLTPEKSALFFDPIQQKALELWPDKRVLQPFPSALKGGEGNQEYWLALTN